MNISKIENIRAFHLLKYNKKPTIIRSPGRANIIGEHTDYNYGKVLPFAIEKAIYFCISKNDSKTLNIEAIDINESFHGSITNLKYQKSGWVRYINNALVALNIKDISGLDITFGGDLPSGAGVSSSSAITCGFIYGIDHIFKLDISPEQMIRLASQAENGIGLNGGVMDQTAIMKGCENAAILIDFNTNEVVTVPIQLENHSFYLIESGQKHNLVETEYNKRRKTCEQAVQIIQKYAPYVRNMADINEQHVNDYLINDKMKNRCLHVIEENNRVTKAYKAILNRDFRILGKLMVDAHESLSKLYEVSTSEIDWLVKRTIEIENVIGSRIMGGGFGGCTINLCKGHLTDTKINKLKADYYGHTGLRLKLHCIKPSAGVSTIDI